MEEELPRKPEFEKKFKTLPDELTMIIKQYLIENINFPTESVADIVERLR